MYNPLIEVISCLTENFIIAQIMNYFLEIKNKKMQPIFIILFTMLALNMNTMTQPVYLLVALIVLNIYVHINYKNSRIFNGCICSAVFTANVFLSVTIITLLTSFNDVYFIHLQNDAFFYACAVFVSKFILIIIFFALRNKLKVPVSKPFDWHIIFLEMILFLLALIYIFYIFIEEYIGAYQSISILIIQALILISTLYVYTKYFISLKEREILKANEIANKAYISSIEKEQMIIGISQKVIHDLKKQAFLLQRSLEQKDLNKIATVLNGIDEIEIPTLIDTPNKALNHLLNGKSYVMLHLHIQFISFIEDDLEFIEPNDLALLVGIMIDCCIEMTKDIDNAYIKFESKSTQDITEVTIRCKCASTDKIINSNEHLVLMKKYNGVYQQYAKDNTYRYIIRFQRIKEKN